MQVLTCFFPKKGLPKAFFFLDKLAGNTTFLALKPSVSVVFVTVARQTFRLIRVLFSACLLGDVNLTDVT